MWLLTSEQEAWLRDSLKCEPEWLQRMVLENFGICEPDIFGGISARALSARIRAVVESYPSARDYLPAPPPRPRESMTYQPKGPPIDLSTVTPLQHPSVVLPPPRVPANDPFGNPRLDTTVE